MKTTLTLLFGIFFSFISISATCYSTGNGFWDDPASWSCGTVPSPGDTIIINPTDTIQLVTTEVYSGAAMVIIINGTLEFASPSAKLHLPCNSSVVINAGGAIINSGGGIPSHNIKICGDLVWEGPEGSVTGPIVLVGPNPLPVDLVNFNIENNQNELNISWSTISERENDYFTIEGSYDGIVWIEIIQINGAGNSTTQINYNHTYSNQVSKYGFIRITQTDYNGTVEEFSARSVIIYPNYTLYPNPSNGEKVMINSDEIIEEISVYSVNGQKIEVPQEVVNTQSSLLLDIPTGSYIVLIKSAGVYTQQKLIVQ